MHWIAARAWIALAALSMPVLASATERLDLAALAARDAFRLVRCDEVLNLDPHESLAFPLELPTVYRPWTSSRDTSGSIVWSRLMDWTRVRNGRRASGRWGVFVAQRSDSLSYSKTRDTFADAIGLTETNLHERLVAQGGTNVRVRRVDREGVPVLLVEADLSELERLRTLYIAAPRGTRKLYYLPQRPWSEADELVWSRLRASFESLPAASEE